MDSFSYLISFLQSYFSSSTESAVPIKKKQNPNIIFFQTPL